VLLCAIGVAVAVVFALIPVGVRFDSDPLLRLRQLDPELSPPAATAVCGSPVSNLRNEPTGTNLYEIARAHACEEAGFRRLLIAVAAGSLIVMFGLVGLAGSTRPEASSTKLVGLLSNREVTERE
jgi:hypothetical protein